MERTDKDEVFVISAPLRKDSKGRDVYDCVKRRTWRRVFDDETLQLISEELISSDDDLG